MTLVAFAPVVLGPIVVVWKDVAFAASLAAASALLYSAEDCSTDARRNLLLGVAILMIFCGMAYRFNGVAGAFPLLAWWVFLCINNRILTMKTIGVLAIKGILLTLMLFSLVSLLNRYRIPSFEPLMPRTSFTAIQIYDLIGMSAIEGRSVFSLQDIHEYDPKVGEYAAQIYSSTQINLTAAADHEGKFTELFKSGPQAISHAWWKSVTSYPISYFSHRWAVFQQLIGCTSNKVFYPTHGGIDQNEYGITHVPSLLTPYLLNYLDVSCAALSWKTLFCRPWIYYLAGIIALIACLGRGLSPQRRACAAIFSSGIAYLFPQFFINPGADLRYNLWSVVAMIISCMIAISIFQQKQRTNFGIQSQ